MIPAFIGCDPGAKGAFCLLVPQDDKPPILNFVDNDLHVDMLNTWLKNCNNLYNIKMSMLEDVHSLPVMTAKSNFSFGKNLGIVDTLLRLQSFGLDKVKPKAWQKEVGVKPIPKGTKRTPVQLKNEVAALCESLYPGCDIRGPKGGLKDGRSDALMIAHYCYLKYK